MKNLLLIVVVFASFLLNSQVMWRDYPHPVLSSLTNHRQATVEFSENGDLYFIYYDSGTQYVKVDKLNTQASTWVNIYSKDVSCCVTNRIEDFVSKKIGSAIYVGYTVDDSDFQFINMFKIDVNENTTDLIEFASTDNSFTTAFDFFVDETTYNAYFVYNKSSGLAVDEFDLSFPPAISVSASSPPILFNASSPKLVPDFSQNELYLFAVDNSLPTYAVFKSPFADILNFSSEGSVSSTLIGGVGIGNNFDVAEKANFAPDVVFSHTPVAEEGVYRVNFTGGNSESMFSEPTIGNFSADGLYDATYVLGQTDNENVVCFEILNNGTYDTVARTENPILQSGVGFPTGDFVLRQKASEEILAGFFYSGLGSRIIRTSTPPQLENYDLGTGLCVGVTTSVIKNLTFFDAEGDLVTLDQVTSSNQSVITNANITIIPNGDGSYDIQALLSNAGITTIEFSFTDDGTNMVTDDVTIEVYVPVVSEFNLPQYEVCSNGNIVDLNSMVTVSGGYFSVDGNPLIATQDNVLDPSEFELAVSPMGFTLDYVFSDVNSCVSYTSTSLIVYDPADITMMVQNSACGNPSGSVEATVSNANGNYISYWNDGTQGVDEITNVPSGNYYITVIDNQGCIAVGQASVLSSDITVNESITPVSCRDGNDGQIVLSVTGAAPPFDVFWSNGMSTANASGLVPGIYEAVITDANGCQVTYSYELLNPEKFEVIYTATPPSMCGGTDGSITFVSATNGAAPYEFEWSNGFSTQDLSVVTEGIYFVEVTDDNGCKYNEKFTINSSGAPFYVDPRVTRSVCGDQTGSIEISLVAASGEEIVDIQWSNGMTTENIYNVPSGYYECVATQSDGCQSMFSWNLGTLPLERPEICILTVDSLTTTNLIVWEKPVTNDIDHYRIYRETSQAGHFMLIDTVNYSSISVFNDVVASPKTKSWRYRISSVNQCGIESPPSDIHKTIHLVIQDLGTGEYKVAWDNYEGITYSEYDVLRYTEQTGWEVILANVPYNALPYTMDQPTSTDGLDYMIEIDPGFQCTATFGKAQDYNSSRSNKARGEFNPGDGTGDPNNSIVELESDAFSALIYPNPTSGDFNIDVNMSVVSNEELTIQILSMDGRLVYEGIINEGLNTISLNNAQSGIYLVNLQKGNASQIGRIVKH